ncbi:hypothetical protein [Lacrimispora aerotolerans]|nr:hypothetical protein [Lacrimispora aerotolerans]
MSNIDSENKDCTIKALAIASLAIAVISGGMIAVLEGKTNINQKKNNTE